MPRPISPLLLACGLLAALPVSGIDRDGLLQSLESNQRIESLADELRVVEASLSSSGNKSELNKRKSAIRHELSDEEKHLHAVSHNCREWFRQCPGDDVNAQDKKGRTLLMLVAPSGSPAAVNMVLEEGPRCDITDKDGRSALDYERQARRGSTLQQHLLARWKTAFEEKDMGTIERLLEAGIAPESIAGDEPAPVLAIRNGDNKLLQLLLSYGLVGRLHTREGHSLLELAIVQGNSEAIAALLGGGVPADEPLHNGHSPLFYLLTHGNAPCLKAYLSYRADMDAATRRAVPSLIVRYGTADMVREHITDEDIANTEDERGNIPIHEAARRGDAGILHLVLERGGSREATNKAGETTLMHAALSGEPECLRLVLEGLADKDIRRKAKDGRRAIDYARESGNEELIRMLEGAGGQP